MKKKLILLPQTYGPYKHYIARQIAQFIIRRAYKVYSRDKESIDVVRKLLKVRGNGGREIVFCPDVAFMLDPIKPDQVDIHPPITNSGEIPLIGLNINGLMYMGGYTKDNMFGLKMDYKVFAHKLALTILNTTNSHILFIPHTFNTPFSDPNACIDIIKSLPEQYGDRTHMVAKEYDQSEIKAIIGQCDFLIGSRMHACIAAISQGIPTVGVAYSKKFKGVFESVGVGDMVVDGRFVDTDEAIDSILQSFNKRAKIKENLMSKIERAKQEIEITFRDIL